MFSTILIIPKSLFQDENMSPADSSDSSDGEGTEMDVKDEPLSMSATIVSKSSISPPSQSTTSGVTQTQPQTTTKTSLQQQPATSSSASSSTASAASILPPLVYQTAQGMMYATPSNGSVIFSLAQAADPNNLGHAQQLIIPLSVMTANGQGELDLSKRK